jgi:[acyl-carrier-protein] S-malonyltransferase
MGRIPPPVELRGRRPVQPTGARVALLFHGQGSQTEGMRDLVAEHRPDLLALAVKEIGEDPFPLVERGTAYAQPALYCASLAGWQRLGRPSGEVIAGHSLGELAALVAAGCLDDRDGLRLAVRRGQLMHEGARKGPEGGMLALLGDEAASTRIAADCGLCIANHNAPGQLVLSGPGPKLDAARTRAKQEGLRTIKLHVEGAFHTPAMECVLPAYRTVLDEIDFRASRVEVFSSTTAQPFDDIRARLAEALIRPVRWCQTLGALQRLGVTVFREVGPGKVLTNLVRRTLKGVDAESLDESVVANA